LSCFGRKAYAGSQHIVRGWTSANGEAEALRIDSKSQLMHSLRTRNCVAYQTT